MSKEKVVLLKGGEKFKQEKFFQAESRHESVQKRVVCNFCGRNESALLNIVRGPGVNICSECIMVAVQYLILKDKIEPSEAQQILDTFWKK